jgi:hypothetical protein
VTAALEPIMRPNGKTYRPRKLSANAVTDCDGDGLEGVVVFGTHDPARALDLADQYVAWQIDSGYAAATPVAVWWRDGFAYGQRRWIDDPERGRAGVWFCEITERTP